MKEELWSNIEKLSELRSKYNCFDEEEQPFYHALSLGIKALKQQDILDKIRDEIENTMKYQYAVSEDEYAEGFEKSLEIIDKYKAESEDKQ